jgi:hypothetical protein
MANHHNLLVSIDVGGSGTKIIYQFAGWSRPQYFLMSPHVEEITRADFQRYQDSQWWTGEPRPLQQAYLQWKDSIFVVGDFATEFAAIDRIHERKYENALYKVLAAVGVILQKNGVNSKKPKSPKAKIMLSLAFLLPWNEYNDHQRFFSQLQQMFKAFKFRGQSWDITLSDNFLCRPEGAGLLAIHTKKQGVNWIQSHKIAILMLGHRNTTLLYFDYGFRKVADSPLLGFCVFLDHVISRVSWIQREQLAVAIFAGLYEAREKVYSGFDTLHPRWDSLKAIQSLATAKDESLRNREVVDIAQAIAVSTADYWFHLKKWLDSSIPELPNEVILGGGAASFLEPELEGYFNCQASELTRTRPTRYKSKNIHKLRANLVWMDQLQEIVRSTLNVSSGPGQQEMAYRLLDCYGMMDQLLDKTKEVKGEKNEKTA